MKCNICTYLTVLTVSLLAVFAVSCSSDSDNQPNDQIDGDDSEAADGDDSEDGDIDEEIQEEDRPALPWPTCEGMNSEKSLAEKAAYFDAVSKNLHIAGDGLLRNLYLNEDLETVEYWFHTENTILWSGMYLASQAFRYAVTGEQEAQENAKIVLEGLTHLTRVTGSRGLYGRSMSSPDVNTNPIAADNPGWTDSPAEGYEGWRFRNDVSQDGYDGLMYGYSAALEHFDDPELLAGLKERLREVMDHFVGNGQKLIDWDGKVTEHGNVFYTALDDYPGFNALLASSWVKIGHTGLDDQELEDFYYGCLMKMRDGVDCPEIDNEGIEMSLDLRDYMYAMETQTKLFISNCKQNYDSFDMTYQAIYPLLRRETDPELRSRMVNVLRNHMFHTDNPDHQSVAPIGNSFYTFSYAALVGDRFGDDPILDDAMEAAVCKLKEFPAEKFVREIHIGTQEEVCRTRLDDPAAADVIPLDEYAFDNYLWRLDFFEISTREWEEDRRYIYSPEDYLVAYWLARYHGFIKGDQ